jgi:two-component system, response regulator RegA
MNRLPDFLDPNCGRLSDGNTRALAAEQHAPTVLVVDDDRVVREVLALGLLARGFNVIIANDGHHAVTQCHAEASIDVLVVDEHMPGMNGLETIAAIRRASPWTRCCLMSGDVRHCLSKDLGIAEFIAKPFALDDLAAVLWRLVQQPLRCFG